MTIAQIREDHRVNSFTKVSDEGFNWGMVLNDGYVFDDGLGSHYGTFNTVKEASHELQYFVIEE